MELIMAIVVSVASQLALQAADDADSNLPSPSSVMIDGRLENICGACGYHPVDGPDTRYRCPACLRIADEYRCGCQHVAPVDPYAGYPETDAAEAMIAAAKKKAPSKRTAVEKELAAYTPTTTTTTTIDGGTEDV
jgi:hypothetical protein